MGGREWFGHGFEGRCALPGTAGERYPLPPPVTGHPTTARSLRRVILVDVERVAVSRPGRPLFADLSFTVSSAATGSASSG